MLDELGVDTVEMGRGFCLEPADWKDWCVFAPFHRTMWRRAKELAGVKVQLHSCGGIEPCSATSPRWAWTR